MLQWGQGHPGASQEDEEWGYSLDRRDERGLKPPAYSSAWPGAAAINT